MRAISIYVVNGTKNVVWWCTTNKTYIVASLTALHAVTGFASGSIDANRALELLVAAAAMATMRHAISKQGASVGPRGTPV